MSRTCNTSSLIQSGRSEAALHRKVYRPWSYYACLDSGPHFQMKRLVMYAGARLSLQRHQRRTEHWVVVNGVGRIAKGEQEFDLKTNESTYIPRGIKHRLENPGTELLAIIEVQSGEYLGEDDIERCEDVYGRP